MAAQKVPVVKHVEGVRTSEMFSCVIMFI